MLKNQRGITLVALVITIVVLIILATISISFAFGNNGLVNRAEQARDFYGNDTSHTEEMINDVVVYLDQTLENAGITQ